MKRFWILILTAGIAIVAMSVFQYLTRPGKGDDAPPFELRSVGGEHISLSRFKGRPVIVHFFATWCGACRKEFPELARFSDAARDKISVVAISEDGEGNDDDVRAFLKLMPAPFPVLMDVDGKVADAYASYGVPESFMIDKDGRILWRRSGAIDWEKEIMVAGE